MAKVIFHSAVLGLAILGVVLLRPDLAEHLIAAVSHSALAQSLAGTGGGEAPAPLAELETPDSAASARSGSFAVGSARPAFFGSPRSANAARRRLPGAGSIMGGPASPAASLTSSVLSSENTSRPVTQLDPLVRPAADSAQKAVLNSASRPGGNTDRRNGANQPAGNAMASVKADVEQIPSDAYDLALGNLDLPPTGNPILEKKLDPLAVRSGLPTPQLIEETRIIGRVGSEVLLAGDVMRQIQAVEEQLQANIFRMSPAEVTKQRNAAMRTALAPLVESKLRFVAAKRGMETKQYTEVVKNIERHFQEDRVKFFMEKTGARNYVELEEKIKEQGGDLQQIRRDFVEQLLGREWQKKEIGQLDEIPHADLLAYYETHAVDYEHPAQALWRQISVAFPSGASMAEKKAAWSKIANAGNRIRGIPGRVQPESFEIVAKEVSTGPTASDGGNWDWTREGSLASRTLDAALFTIPVGELSKILEDGNSFHIVQVIERKEAGKTSFAEVQQSIRDKLMEEKMHEAEARYMAKLRAEIPTFTIYDKDE